jgi:dUTP pyrophosphatase
MPKPRENKLSRVQSLRVKKIHKDATIPQRKNEGDAGLDLSTTEAFTLEPGERRLVPTGLCFGIPDGYYGQIKPRSGLASKGVTVDGGVIDRGYTGEVKVILCNHDKEKEFKFNVGDRIAQVLFLPVLIAPLVEVDNLEETDRGDRGFGSTGMSDMKKPCKYARYSLKRSRYNEDNEGTMPKDWARDF